jgi:ubiquinone/menaquinone biosynthesis C-methylase UbiE
MTSDDPRDLTRTEWRNVDDGIADAAARYLDTMMRVLAAQKQQTLELLRLKPGMSVIEIGCGNGRDAEAVARLVGPGGRVVGIDASQELIAQATERTASLGLPLRFQVDDAHALAFADNSFDAARVDRVLQHLNDPGQAVREMARVVRPGGRMSAIEPDWQTMTVAGVDNEVTRAVVRYKVDINITHGTIGRELRRLMVEAGCIEVTAEQGSITFERLAPTDFVLGLRRNLAGAVSQRWVTGRQAADWWAGLEEQDSGGKFFAAMSGIIAGATVR